ncbi:MAG: sugar transferase [Terracidiphilus sp.]
MFYRRYGKRALDLVSAPVLLILLSPLFLAIALVIRIKFGPPVIFRQMRPGRGEKLFCLLKFRTMTDERDERGASLPDQDRLTRIGSLVRSLSLDELPQLWNVFKGNMSLVGPRPLLVEYLTRYTPEQARRHEVTPGITGWAQVNGRNAVSWDERFALDVWYVDHQSFGLDLRVLLLTASRVIRRSGVSSPGHATMETFMGSDGKS